ncbi:PREDICTED: putative ankyrin repeat protein RF_0381 [Nicrophorus vespilloides]|uniref:Ankyrin repeat protein RF_0381 n=1 Tax=Nicrophorus vespilloides TaxID=110193 RepID=A0ABM1NF02_NICVS|nr:PREDICTED: putative ankyrin repeat protein RF_0381 [Nicrophorus vespilloides]
MDIQNELLVAIDEGNLNTIKSALERGANVNRISSRGITPLGAAVQTGNLAVLKVLTESTKLSLNLDGSQQQQQRNNIGYFVVCKDLDEFGDGPTPDGMDALEWDMEIRNENSAQERPVSPDISLYNWYAKILNQTSILLKSPEYDISRLDSHGQNVLHYSVRCGHMDMVEYLLDNYDELDVNQCDGHWCSPLHIACRTDRPEMVQLLIKKGADVNGESTHRETPLHVAAQMGDLEAVKVLIENGANVNVYNMEDRSPLSMAICNLHEHVAEYLVGKGTRLNQEECLGYTVLYKAVWNNLYSTTKLLLKAGAKIINSHHLLHLATNQNNLDMVKLIHEAGAFVNTRDDHGNTPLMTACLVRNLDIASYYLRNGAPANSVNQITGMSALHLCVQHEDDPEKFRQFLDLLTSCNADINANSHQGNVLFYSIILNNVSAASLLIKYGADVNSRDEHGYFDNLSVAKKQGNFDLVRLLVYAGFRYRNLLFDVKSLKDDSGDDQIYDFIVQTRSKPMNLRDLCRIRVRACLGRQLHRRINKLPLPSIIQKYLAFEIL